MNVLLVGMSYKTAPVTLLEDVSLTEDEVRLVSERLKESGAAAEAMIVSTCNRMEVYAVVNGFHRGVQGIVQELSEVSGLSPETLRDYLYVRYGDEAARHLMTVCAGLDSMVVGEQQIIGQIRQAYQAADGNGSVGRTLHSLLQAALRAGKRVHAETAIDEAGASMVSYALGEAASLTGDGGKRPFRGRNALVLGAGAMASLAASHLGKMGVERLYIANRTRERADRLAEHSRQAGVPATAVDFERRHEALDPVDLAVSATGAGRYTITAGDIPAERSRDLTLVDLSLPRDIDEAAARIRGVHLINIEWLRRNEDGRDLEKRPASGEARRLAEQIVEGQVQEFLASQRVRAIGPTVAALRSKAAEISRGELERLQRRAPGLEGDELSEVTRTVQRVVDKLLHEPTVRIKQLAAESGSVSYDTAIQDLFGLAPEGAPGGVAVSASELPASDFQARERSAK